MSPGLRPELQSEQVKSTTSVNLTVGKPKFSKLTRKEVLNVREMCRIDESHTTLFSKKVLSQLYSQPLVLPSHTGGTGRHYTGSLPEWVFVRLRSFPWDPAPYTPVVREDKEMFHRGRKLKPDPLDRENLRPPTVIPIIFNGTHGR